MIMLNDGMIEMAHDDCRIRNVAISCHESTCLRLLMDYF
jgi:hypothetical protein